jgi:hypothetical protein
MTRHWPIPYADIVELILKAAGGVFPGPALEALIDRVEAAR